MKNNVTDLSRRLARHFSALCRVPVSLVDSCERRVLVTENPAENFYCRQCPNRCQLPATMLYGCNEARRWNGKYTFYCPIGLVFSAIALPDTDYTLICGPMAVGDPQDTLFDLPDNIPREALAAVHICSADELNHLSSILEMGAYGVHYRPAAYVYDQNDIFSGYRSLPGPQGPAGSFPFLSELSEELRSAVDTQDKKQAGAVLNRLLQYVYSAGPEQYSVLQGRAVQLTALLSNITDSTGADSKESFLYQTSYPRRLREAPSPNDLDVTLTEILHHFMDYTFDFSAIKHSDTVYRIMEYIKSNYSEKISLDQLAAYTYLSKPYISSLFRRETGMTVSAYINQVRIEKSKLLLKQAGIPIVDIASLCGFEDQSYFTKVFKKQLGISPKKYRDNALSDYAFTSSTATSEAEAASVV